MVQAFSGCPWKVVRFVISIMSIGCCLLECSTPLPLGYGATTLPALTEAITFEKNVTLAQHEAGRLQLLIDKLTKKIEV